MSNLIKVDNDYKKWISEISKRFKQSQIKASVKANSEMLRFYWSLGRDIVEMSEKNGYGSVFYKTLSSDLKDIFPDLHSLAGRYDCRSVILRNMSICSFTILSCIVML